nr:TBCC domain-containing protein [Tanacetum cinerariifolium]
MAVNSTDEGCDEYSIVLLSDDCDTGLQCELPIALPSPAEVRFPLKSQLSLDARLSNQSFINMMVENAVAYSTCTVDVDIENGKSETQSNEETCGNLKDQEVLTKSLQKQISFDMGGKYMQLLMNHSLMLSKFSTRDKVAGEKILDAPRSRKYKRAASFNSRKVVLMFSVLSCLGTMILIYLTLRVRQIGDVSLHSE